MSASIRLGISTCPNDTFAFHAILNERIDLGGLNFETSLLDIQELNQRILADEFDVAKASFALAHQVADRWFVLPSGSALGYGVGPLLLASSENIHPHDQTQTTLCPGQNTTAHLLFQMFYGQTSVRQVLFSEIMPALCHGDADFGVCIHEGRFTYAESGLFLIEDLGTRWEQDTKSPLPLGGILSSRKLDTETISKVQDTIRRSIEYGLANRDETLPTMRKYAQEFGDDVLMKHVELYVNDWTVELGDVGKDALNRFSERCRKLNGSDRASIEVFEKS